MKRFQFPMFPDGGDGGAGGGGGAAGGGAPGGGAAGGGAPDPNAGGGAAGGGGAPPARPDYVPEKFWRDGKPDLEGMGKSYIELERSFHQRQPQGIVVPAADAPAEAHAAFRKAMGIPDDPRGYQLKPEKLPDGIQWDDARGAQYAALAHKHGLTPAAAKELVEFQLQSEVEARTSAQIHFDNLMAQRMESLKREWGTNFAAKLGQTKMVATALGYDPEDAELFGNPKVLQFLGKVSGMLSEDAVAGMRGVVGGSGKFTTPAEEARDITRNPNNPEHAAYMRGDPAIKAKVVRLYNSGG